MAEVTTSHENYWVAPEEDREGNHKYISHDTSDSHGNDMKVPVESAVIIDVGVNINTDPLHMFPEDNHDPTLQWGSCNSNRWLYFIPPEAEQTYYKGSNFAVLAIPSYAYYGGENGTRYYKCSGYMTDNEPYMTTDRAVVGGTTVEDFIDTNQEKNKTLQYNPSNHNWSIVTVPTPQFNPQIDHTKLISPKPPVSTQYFGLTTQETRTVFSGEISTTQPSGIGTYTTTPYKTNDGKYVEFQLGTTLYWNINKWSTT